MGKANVPTDLYPIMMERANKLIDEYYSKSMKMSKKS